LILDAPYEIGVNLTRDDDHQNNIYIVKLGDAINCSANGYPPPKVRWIPLAEEDHLSAVSDNETFSAAADVETGWELFTVTRSGTERWKCSAANDRIFSDTLSLTVTFKGWLEYIYIQIGQILFI